MAAVLMAPAGCRQPGPTIGPADPRPVAPATSSIPPVKPVAPIDVTLSVHPVPLAADREFSVQLRAAAHGTVRSVRADFSASGVVSLVGTHGVSWDVLVPGSTRTTETQARIGGQGSGEIHGNVTGDLPVGAGLGRTAVLYVLATGDEVLVGVDGPTTLQLTHLDHLLADGRITRQEYEQRRDAVISGG
jgi:hypothetical protein